MQHGPPQILVVDLASGRSHDRRHYRYLCNQQQQTVCVYLIGSGSNLYGYAGVWVSTDEGVSWTNTHPSNAIGNSPTAYAVPSHTNLMASNGLTGFNQGFMIWLLW